MDKLRAIEYLVRVIEAGSFAAAARELDVSPPAVTQLIAARP
jgi:DNA-binding transcriptional LysR family regulator